MKVLCTRCGGSHDDVGSGNMTQGYRCAASVREGTITGHYGSTVIDMESRPVAPEANVADGTDPICDGCVNALDAAGFLGEIEERSWPGPDTGAEAWANRQPQGSWVSIADMDEMARAELAQAIEDELAKLP